MTLKWNKQVYQVPIIISETSVAFKHRVEALTGVPIDRQKLLAKKGGWKGPLKDDTILDASTIKETKSLAVTLIGSSETLAGPTQKTTFIEDLSLEELQAAEDAQAQAAMATAEGMIPALQLPPHRRDDRKQEFYQYNRLVSGLPQRQIEQELKYGQGANHRELQGKVVMTLGMELRRSYVNDLAVLSDGTCVSAMDDGHVQLWKHGAQQQDAVHFPGGEGGVDNVVALRQRPSSPIAFATAGRGVVQLWSREGDPMAFLQNIMPGTTPSSLTSVYGGTMMEHIGNNDNDNSILCLASRSRVTRHVNPFQFRLPPQNEEERQRRAQAEAQERAVQEALDKISRCVQIWFSVDGRQESDGLASATSTGTSQIPSLRTKILEPTAGPETSASVTALACLSFPDGSRLLCAGDTQGGIRIWQARRTAGGDDLEFHQCGFYQLKSGAAFCSIVNMEALSSGRLAVSTDHVGNISSYVLTGATSIPIQAPRAVHILDFSQCIASMDAIPTLQSTLTGHAKDAVICMCQLPNGDLLTGGGKLDATLQLWSGTQVAGGATALEPTARKILSDVGYVFSLTVLPDAKDGSSYYAVAAARYNSVKIVI